MNRQPIRGTIKREPLVTAKQKYVQAYEKFINGEFTYDAHCLLQNLAEKGKKEPNMQGVPLYKTLIQIAKILMMNQLQILFLGATLEEMKWKIIDNCLNTYIQDFKGLNDKLKNDTYNKKIQLSLVLIGYVVKVYLNQTQETSAFQFRIRELVSKDYDKMYQQWVEKMKKNFKFIPKNMNKLFREMDVIRAKKQSQLDEVNYNSKVQQLFKIFVEPDMKHSHEKVQQPFVEHQIEQEQQIHPAGLTHMARTESLQSLRSFGRKDSQRSQRDYGGFMLRNIPSIFRNNSIDE